MSDNTATAGTITPGDLLREEIVARADVTQDTLAKALGVSRYSVNQLMKIGVQSPRYSAAFCSCFGYDARVFAEPSNGRRSG